jgi:hypothetical protein
MSTYPDFDADGRTNNAAARKVESALRALAADLEGPTAAAIQSAIQELTQRRSNCQKLSEKVNAQYKRSKKECIELQQMAATVDKCKQEKTHAVTKAREYHAQVRILEKRVVDLGGTVPDMKKAVAKSLKRSVEEVEVEQDYVNLMLYPQKRNNVNGSVEDFAQVPVNAPSYTHAALASPSQLPTPSQSSTKSLSQRASPPSADSPPIHPSPPPPRHLKPTPKAKPANFSKNIPLGKEQSFASIRFSQPNKLHDPTKSSSHVTAVMQGLSATSRRRRQSTLTIRSSTWSMCSRAHRHRLSNTPSRRHLHTMSPVQNVV